MSLCNQNDGLAVTNNFYLMAMDLITTACDQPRDAEYDYIMDEVNALLASHRVSSTTLDKIWMDIFQAPGYEPDCWMANLVQNGVPEELFGPVLQIMTTASKDHHKTHW